MVSIDTQATWHKASYDRFLNEQLPQLLAERLPLAGYQVVTTDTYHCQVVVALITETGQQTEVTYTNVPQPDEHGIFWVDDSEWTVVPLAANEDLETATVLCVGDMLANMLQERLGEAPPELPWNETLLRAWLPLDSWIRARFGQTQPEHPYDSYFQRLDTTNWLARRTHLRRLFMQLSDPSRVITPGQFGRLCPYEKPEGPNMGRIGVIALGATIRAGQVTIIDDRPEATLGLSMSAIPLVEHSDANRLLMGTNMMRQWLPYNQPEPALVQTGNEPAVPEFWCGRNLLTAFIAWGADTVEDGIVLSESGARHLSNSDHQVEPGDKLSNRFGIKGVISRILPDATMPMLADGTPVELIFSSVGIHSRLAHGQLWEAVLGRLARAEGEPIIAPPFYGPTEAEVKQRLAAAGLPVDGMEQLRHGERGEPLPYPSLAGWLYWGRTDHLVRNKLEVTADSRQGMQRQSELEYQLLRELGATATIRSHFHTLAAWGSAAGDGAAESTAEGLAASIAAGTMPVPTPSTPRFAALQSRLAATGIAMTLDRNQLHFRLQPPSGAAIELAQPVPHPWLGEHQITQVGAPGLGPDQIFPYTIAVRQRERQLPSTLQTLRLPEFAAVARANEKLARLIANGAPTALRVQAHTQLAARIQHYFAVLLTPEDLRFDSRVAFSGHTVLAPGADLRHDQVGLAEKMAWALYGPQVIYHLNQAGADGAAAVASRTPQAAGVLDEILAQSWIIVRRVPAVRPTAMIAFHPVRIPDKVLRIPPIACVPLDADFDGDQASVFLPIGAAAQQEAGERLSLAGHLARDPELLADLAPFRDPMLGLALHSQHTAGRAAITQILGAPPDFAPGYVTRSALTAVLKTQLADQGAAAVLATLDGLNRLGFAALKETGFSLSPFADLGLETPPPPPTDRPDLWENYMQQRVEQLWAASTDQAGWGHYVLASRCGAVAENRVRLLAFQLVARGVVPDVHGDKVVIEQSLRTGLTPQQHFATVPGAQHGLRSVAAAWEESGTKLLSDNRSKSFHILARARRAASPGIVFARAAALQAVDPLVDEESRFFVGV